MLNLGDLFGTAEKVINRFSLKKEDFLDIRFFIGEGTTITIRNAASEQMSSEFDIGVGLRALVNGAWGFSTCKGFSQSELYKAMKAAIKVAKAVSGVEKNFVPEGYIFEGEEPLKIKVDPREIALEEKVKVAVELEKNIAQEGSQVKVSSATISDMVQREVIINSLGTRVDVSNCYVRLSGGATVREGSLIQNVSESVGTSRGWETFMDLNPSEMGTKIGKRGIALLSALTPPGGNMKVVMDPSLVGVFIHEAFGHACEADSVLSNMSVLSGKLEKKVGVPSINVIDDPTIPGLRGSYAYDSEGTKTNRRLIVDRGVFKGYLHSLETAAKMGVPPNGAGRAADFNFKPIPRMSNTFIDGGDMSLEELCEEVKTGIFLAKSYGGYVNPAVGQFFFTAQEGHLIENGKVGSLIQNVSMAGLTLEVLPNVIGVGKDLAMDFGGTCGKDSQWVPVIGGGPHIAVRDIIVGGYN